MTAWIGLLGLGLLVWVMMSLLVRLRFIRSFASIILSVIFFQIINYFYIGFLDPFFLIAAFFTGLVLTVEIASLEATDNFISKNYFSKLKYYRVLTGIFGIACVLYMIYFETTVTWRH